MDDTAKCIFFAKILDISDVNKCVYHFYFVFNQIDES